MYNQNYLNCFLFFMCGTVKISKDENNFIKINLFYIPYNRRYINKLDN